MATSLHIGIVGGSIAGCAAALVLSRRGHQVTVFERSTGKLRGRGGGIATPVSTFRLLVDEDLVDADFPHTIAREMPLIGRGSPDDPQGRTAWSLPVDLACFHWGTLWENLRKRVADAQYLSGRHVANVRTLDHQHATLELDDGESHQFDLVLFADGYHSMGRRLLHPSVDLSYRGYALWRGLLEERSISDCRPLDAKMARLSYADVEGHLVIYFVPGLDESTREGERLYNWAAYLPIADDALDDFMMDREGQRHAGSIPPGSLRSESEATLKTLMAANLPTYYADIIAKSEDTYIQLIYTAEVPAYARDRICLLGDAGSVVQPFTISGIFKGFNNARDLVNALAESNDVDEALAHWSDTQTKRSNQILRLGQQMERALIWDIPDLATMDPDATARWWESAVTFDDDFTHRNQD